MPGHTVRRHLAFDPAHLFELVADVERYPEFVPWWVAATVASRDGDVYYTRQVVGLPMMRHEFHSKTELMRPNAIRITSSDKPFKSLDMLWTFNHATQGGCDVSLDVAFELAAARFGMLAGIVSGEGIRRLVNAFEERARRRAPTAVVSAPMVQTSPPESVHADENHEAEEHGGRRVCSRRVIHRSVMHHDHEHQTVSTGL